MILTEQILQLTVDATLRAIRRHGGARVAVLPIAPPGSTTRLEREHAQALLLRCAVTQLRLQQARPRAQATAPEPTAAHIKHASTP